jgi:hypothetical protein
MDVHMLADEDSRRSVAQAVGGAEQEKTTSHKSLN